MKPLQIRLAILLFGAVATVGGIAGFRDAKSSTKPLHLPSPIPVLTVSGAAGTKGNS
jgi:hypothetical protein